MIDFPLIEFASPLISVNPNQGRVFTRGQLAVRTHVLFIVNTGEFLFLLIKL